MNSTSVPKNISFPLITASHLTTEARELKGIVHFIKILLEKSRETGIV